MNIRELKEKLNGYDDNTDAMKAIGEIISKNIDMKEVANKLKRELGNNPLVKMFGGKIDKMFDEVAEKFGKEATEFGTGKPQPEEETDA